MTIDCIVHTCVYYLPFEDELPIHASHMGRKQKRDLYHDVHHQNIPVGYISMYLNELSITQVQTIGHKEPWQSKVGISVCARLGALMLAPQSS